ncbi:hypothetical protein [Polycyclovorans algicola]|uniref:hypothetical protein n=1 Tax=Polycyclovorans algicola TaxID=616992 RepID=UPI0012688230|nr:hypothetical protein [Polycyclovorans algicola]
MNDKNAVSAVHEVIRELCRLIDSGSFMKRNQFHELSEQERFVAFLIEEFSQTVRFDYLADSSPLFEKDIFLFVENAFGRHANVVVMEDFGLRSNSLLLAINICVAILRELQEEA